MHQSGGHRAYSSPGPVAASTPSGPVAALPGSVASPAMKAAPPTYAIQGGRFPSGPRGIANGPGGVPNGGGPTPTTTASTKVSLVEQQVNSTFSVSGAFSGLSGGFGGVASGFAGVGAGGIISQNTPTRHQSDQSHRSSMNAMSMGPFGAGGFSQATSNEDHSQSRSNSFHAGFFK
ncbi:hypothetical protein MJO28_001508 [Puccinia striiformis f. sp. tritici]|uniref:Uncharacterized protein n=4 Tax=Puccinia striiformis TaxID=27350 RepID=A0A0L0UX17_9BASI|nr:hypothetical protein MJO28_001508 [Puccinia striiformis f. sp. tritici]KAI7965792.1 hypothetical protein MJO29_001540 [Puccinia striiformis f. sp. tritici]KNE91570.1 hypothetical protein PSTG_15022 [Puccinia striiformis f. sp. tritici PST-78]POW16317.1 hypothetical protein PSTT_01523 [Puccinia striiformis]POW19506.1 hypothetical protein PSHT_04632 [Puccinia striiformis]